MKVVINRCWGGFGLSHAAAMRYAELAGIRLYPWIGHIDRQVYGPRAVVGFADAIHHYSRVPLETLARDEHGDPKMPSGEYWSESDLRRDDPALVQVVEELGDAANGRYAKLRIVDVPDGIEWELDDYDGQERIEEKHRSWA